MSSRRRRESSNYLNRLDSGFHRNDDTRLVLAVLCHEKFNSLPFKGRVRVGMGQRSSNPTPIPTFPLRGKGFAVMVLGRFDTVRLVRNELDVLHLLLQLGIFSRYRFPEL